MGVRGLAALETAALLVLLLPLLFGALGLIDFVGTVMAVNAEVDKAVYENAAPPLRLEMQGNQVETIVETGTISRFVEDAAIAMESALRTRLGSDFPTPARYLIETQAVVIAVDEEAGTVIGQPQQIVAIRRGGLTPSGASERDTDLQAEFLRISARTLPGPTGQPIALVAVPGGTLGRDQSAQFVNTAVLIGARAVVSLEETFPGELYAIVGGTPVAYDMKVVQLRGEFG